MKNWIIALPLSLVAMPLTAQNPDVRPDEFVPDMDVVNPQAWVDSALIGIHPVPGPETVNPNSKWETLTEEDYRQVADELGIEAAAIKAVVEIEAGVAHKGFWAPGKPIINFDLSMYRRAAKKYGVSLSAAQRSHPVIFARPNIRKYGSQQAGQQARLDAAKSINSAAAIEGTFWGMFQIGGFNWKPMGYASPQEFEAEMCKSERSQLEMFARFIEHFGMVDDLRKKNWLGFALKYNGASARARGYHTRMARAYNKYK
ncbi:MAG: N-acetylmuramidase family protein [Muribaculaceae bacterium]